MGWTALAKLASVLVTLWRPAGSGAEARPRRTRTVESSWPGKLSKASPRWPRRGRASRGLSGGRWLAFAAFCEPRLQEFDYAPIALLLSSIIQPKCRQRGSRLGSCWCRPRSSSPAMRLPLPVVRRELHHETDGSERIEHEDRVLSRGRISACVHKRSSQSSSAAALPANSSASREYTRNISSDLWPV